jgi:ketosteroid isomerase-like protein
VAVHLADGSQDEALIRQLLARRAQAIRERDARGVLAAYSSDAVCFELAPPLSTRAEQALEAGDLQSWFDSWRGPIGVESRDLRVSLGRDLAFAHALERMTGTKLDGEQVDLWYRATNCLKKERGAWKIAHAHHSVPFYMDGSYRAAVDLKP